MSQPLMKLADFEFWVEGLDHPECVSSAADGSVYAGGEAGQIYRIDAEGKVQQIATTGGFILGICLDAANNVYACDLKQQKLFRVTPGGDVTLYSSGTTDRPMVTPNFPVFDAQGNLYVSDSGHWKQDDGRIYRVRPGGKTEVWTSAPGQFPNGLALSRDGKSLFVVLSLMPGVARVAINADGSAGETSPLVTLPRTVPDGLALDEDQNLYISCYTPDIIYRRSPAGELSVFAEDWQHVVLSSPTNLAFCASDRRKLVVASLGRRHVAQAQMSSAGQTLNYPRI